MKTIMHTFIDLKGWKKNLKMTFLTALHLKIRIREIHEDDIRFISNSIISTKIIDITHNKV